MVILRLSQQRVRILSLLMIFAILTNFVASGTGSVKLDEVVKTSCSCQNESHDEFGDHHQEEFDYAANGGVDERDSPNIDDFDDFMLGAAHFSIEGVAGFEFHCVTASLDLNPLPQYRPPERG